MAESPFRQGTCAYCGSVGDVTDDHVIPKCLWPGRVRKDAPIVDSCKPCNHIWKSEYDTYLRDILVNDKACAKNPIAQKVRERYYRSAANNHSIMARDLAEHAKLVGLQEPSGLISGFAKTLLDAEDRCKIILPLIVRGLHQFYLHSTLPKDTPFQVARVINRQEMEALTREMNEKGGAYQNIGTGDVFQCAFWPRPGHLYPEVWILNFYRSIRFVVSIRAYLSMKDRIIVPTLVSKPYDYVPFFVSD
jgi:hypothetical protein